MDPNQTTGTAPSRVNDIDPVRPDSGTGVTPTGLTGAIDATETAQMQRIPPIGTLSQDRSLSINQTSIPERAGARGTGRASSCKHSRKRSNAPRFVKTDVEPPKHRTVRYSIDPKRSIWTLNGRKFTTAPTARYDPPKLKLQWIGRNRHLAPTPTKHSDPIPEQINGKARGPKDTDPTTVPFYLRETNSIRNEDLPSSGIR
ncbi:hypothetical protein F2Q70_00004079 [Brassica cretica]|uniref:Uncharacterized protein n=1 Tax=Brassica cretica TaxID=69181 RepID=A0A8S9J2W1_BRACR|nr:hypothetical protein F2Q70_00004079 [Brassica cretica]